MQLELPISAPANRWRRFLIFGCGVLLLAGLFLWPNGIVQDPAYHSFADARTYAGVPNFQNVLSNLGFLIVGLYGIYICFRNRVGPMRVSWVVFFAGVTLTTFGSGYYHLDPSNETLMWDRLPMTLGFVGLFIAAVGEYLGLRAEHYLIPAIVLGFASVLIWSLTGDLRLYIWVQALPLITVPLMILLGRRRFTHSYILAIAVGIYALAKAFELLDARVFEATNGAISGHAIKHIVAAAACFAVVVMLAIRNEISSDLLPDAKR